MNTCPKCGSNPRENSQTQIQEITDDFGTVYHNVTGDWTCGSFEDERGFHQTVNDCRIIELERENAQLRERLQSTNADMIEDYQAMADMFRSHDSPLSIQAAVAIDTLIEEVERLRLLLTRTNAAKLGEELWECRLCGGPSTGDLKSSIQHAEDCPITTGGPEKPKL